MASSSSSSSPFSHLPYPPPSGGGIGGGGATSTSAAVDAIIAEAMDICALEHIAALNTAHLLPDSSLLPSHIESRFRTLKSFPPTDNGAAPPLHRSKSKSAAVPASLIESEVPSFAGKGSKPNPPSRFPASPPPPPISPRSSRRGGGGGSSSSPSPPRRQATCCFAFSPRRGGGGGGGKGTGDLGIGDWGESNERMVAELKEQRRKLKKALQEQEKVRREAAKMVRLAKQASARLTTISTADDLLRDEDEDEGELFK